MTEAFAAHEVHVHFITTLPKQVVQVSVVLHKPTGPVTPEVTVKEQK